MKEGIHPKYEECTVTCACGNTFVTRSTKPKIRLEICSSCHPFFTGKQKLIDTAGRVERFKKRFEDADGNTIVRKKVAKKKVIKKPKSKILSTSPVRRKAATKKETKETKKQK